MPTGAWTRRPRDHRAVSVLRTKYPRVLTHREFRRLWIGQSVSTVGDRLVLVAIPLYLTELTGSARDLGLVLAAYTGPLVAVILFGGVLADRLPRQRVMIGADLVRGSAYAALAVVVLVGHPPVGVIAGLMAVSGAAEAFFRPAYTGLVPQTVPEDSLQQAQAMNSWSLQFAQLLGPALATALVVGPGAGTAFAFDALTFLVSIFFLARVTPRRRGRPGERGTVLGELLTGLREVRRRRWLWITVAVASFTLMVGFAPWLVLGPLVARHGYGHAFVWGVIVTTYGVGTVSGALVGLRWRPGRPLAIALGGLLLTPVLYVCFALAAPLPIVILGAVAAGAAVAIFDILWETAVAERVPPHVLSRVSAFDWMGSLALTPIGYMLAGTLALHVPPQTLMLWSAALTSILVVFALAQRETRELRRIEYAAAQRP